MAGAKKPADEPQGAPAPVSGSGATPEDPEAARGAVEAQAAELPEGATVTEEDYAAGQAAAANPPPPDPGTCVNCGQPATKRTTSVGHQPMAFCDSCAAQVYPDGAGLEDISAPTE